MKKQRKAFWMKVLIAVLFISGVTLLSYSSICNIYNNIINAGAQAQYTKTIKQNSGDKIMSYGIMPVLTTVNTLITQL